MKTILASLVMVTLLIPICSNAQDTLTLQEKCLEEGKKFFFERIKSYGGSWGSFSDEKGHGYNDFTTHYSMKFGKCFIRIEYSYFPREEKSIKSIEIYDVLAGKRFAGCSLRILSPPDCNIGEKTCNSLSEFETLIKPYVESKEEAREADWKYFALGDDGIFYWYDAQRMTYQPNRTVQVWIKKVKAEEIMEIVKSGAKITVRELEHLTSKSNYERSLVEIDCVENTFNILQKLNYDSKGVSRSGESKPGGKKPILKKSGAEKLYQAVCK